MARIVILEDQNMVLSFYRQLFAEFTSHEVVYTSQRGLDFRMEWPRFGADLALLDMVLPDCDGISIAQELIAAGPLAPKVLVVTGELTEVMVRRILRSRVQGFIGKSGSIKQLLHGTEEVLAGRRYYCPHAQRLIDSYRDVAHACDCQLSKRELKLLPLFAVGHGNTEIAEKENISTTTAQTHRRNVMSKLGVHTTIDLKRYCLQVGILVKLPDGSLASSTELRDYRVPALTC